MGPGGTVNYLFDGLSVIQETDGGGNLLKKYNPGISETDSTGTELFYSHDGLGSVVNLTDAKGNLVDKTEYEAFGLKSETKSGFYFTGATDAYTDADVGLVYMWNRWYDEGTGGFISSDPLYVNSGKNSYTYCSNNPIDYIDPLGLSRIRARMFYVTDYLGWVNPAADFSVGFDKTYSFGVGSMIREEWQIADLYNQDSGWYTGGKVSGVLTAVSLTGVQAWKDYRTIGGVFGRGGAAAGGILNSNNYLRIGWSWYGSAEAGREIFRIGVGSKNMFIHLHIPLNPWWWFH